MSLSTNALSFDASSGKPCEYQHKPYITRESTFLLLMVWVYLHSVFFCGGLWMTRLLCSKVRIGRSRSSKIVDFGTNRKGVWDFLLVINSNFGPILHRFWEAASYWLKIANFFYPTVILRPHSGEPFKISVWTFRRQDQIPLVVRRWRFRDPNLHRFDTVPACDREMDRRRDEQLDRS